MNTYKGKGSRVQWTNGTGSDVSSGDVVDLGDIFGIAVIDIADGVTGTLMIDELHVLTARTAGAWKAGDDVYWDASNENLTEIGGSANKFIGKAIRDKTASTDTTNIFKLNAGVPISPELLDKVWENHDANYTLDKWDNGKVINVTTNAIVITLPATIVGYRYVIRNGGADATILVTVSPNAADNLYGADLVGVDNRDRLNTLATACRGDFISILGDGTVAGGWNILAQKGTWANA